ncbi:MAG: adenosylmethionine decarboxylase [Actinomycetota bacterium]
MESAETEGTAPVSHDAAGTHLLIDLWGASGLDEMETVREALVASTRACGATLVELTMHGFAPSQGITGLALLAESHISIHSWPEHGYAAVDIFVCGACDPYRVIPVLQAAFRPARVEVNEQLRGVPKPRRDGVGE